MQICYLGRLIVLEGLCFKLGGHLDHTITKEKKKVPPFPCKAPTSCPYVSKYLVGELWNVQTARQLVMASSAAYPPGVSPPLTTDTENDHSGLIVIVTALFLVFALVSVAARVYSSYKRHLIQRDDYLFGALVVGDQPYPGGETVL